MLTLCCISINHRKLQRKLNYKMSSHIILVCFSRDLMRLLNHGKVKMLLTFLQIVIYKWIAMRLCQPFESPYATINYSFDDGGQYRIYIQKA